MTGDAAPPAQTQRMGLYEAIWALTSELSLNVVLQKVADLSRELAEASYSALGVLGDDGSLVRFITSGMSQQGRERIGRLPEGRGVLGVVLREAKPLRLADIAHHPESVGFPLNWFIMMSDTDKVSRCESSHQRYLVPGGWLRSQESPGWPSND